jgi:hypothetical protein
MHPEGSVWQDSVAAYVRCTVVKRCLAPLQGYTMLDSRSELARRATQTVAESEREAWTKSQTMDEYNTAMKACSIAIKALVAEAVASGRIGEYMISSSGCSEPTSVTVTLPHPHLYSVDLVSFGTVPNLKRGAASLPPAGPPSPTKRTRVSVPTPAPSAWCLERLNEFHARDTLPAPAEVQAVLLNVLAQRRALRTISPSSFRTASSATNA